MKGFGMYSINNVGWIEKEAPKAGPLDAICRPIAVAPCSSDTHVSHGGGPFENRILGHESVGEVVEVGSLVRNIKPGDRVVVNCCTPTGRLRCCRIALTTTPTTTASRPASNS